MQSLENRRFLFVTGKGGAGKTSVSAALALALSRAGSRVLVTTSGARDTLSPMLASAGLAGAGPRAAEAIELGTEIRRIAPNLWGVRLEANVAMREYGAMVLHTPKLVNALFDNKYVEGLFSGAPGLKEWALLGKAWYHSTERLPNGEPRFNVIVFDAPATGHGLDMLRVPRVILSAAPEGRLRKDAERALNSLKDPAQSGVVVVSLPEEMPTNETLELLAALETDLGLPVAEIVLNSTLEQLFSDEEGRALEPFATYEGSDPAEAALGAAARRALSERAQRQSLERLSLTGVQVRALPRLDSSLSPAALASALSAYLP
ncbi:MAG TPA: ArsA-related P-loop ATPase [Polyangiaceae bacterium]|nr:ArsA-related P-loop ATPase [Polyangiaceae bacterium]